MEGRGRGRVAGGKRKSDGSMERERESARGRASSEEGRVGRR